MQKIPETEENKDSQKTETPKNLGEPKTEAERAREHFNISEEEWNEMTPEERQAKIDDLPERGEGQKTSEEYLSTIKLLEKSEEEDTFIIGGYANVYMLDKDGEIVPDFDGDVITLEALDEGIKTMMSDPSRRNHMYYHTNIQIGEILEEYTDSDGVTWKTHVVYETDEQYTKKGLFIVCKLFDDCPLSVESKDIMERGHMLAFSVGGIPLEENQVCDGDKCWNEISKFYLAEVSSCERGINAESKGFIVKLDKDTQIYYSSVDNNNNGYIGETAKTSIDDVELSINDSEPNITSDIDGELDVKSKQKEENNLNDNQEEQSDCGCTDEETINKVKELAETLKAEVTSEELIEAIADILWINPDSLKAILAPIMKGETEMENETENLETETDVEEVEDEEQTESVEKEIEEVSDEPIRADYTSFSEYAEAVVSYDAAQKAKIPASKKEVEELKKQIAELKKMLEEKTSDESIGEVVRKSKRVKQPTTDDFEIDLDKKLDLVTKSQKPRSKLE